MGLGKIFGALGASNPLVAAGASVFLDKMGGASQSPGDIVDPSEYKLSEAKNRAMSMVTKAQQQAEKLGDEKLLDQIGNTITYFTRAHVVKVSESQKKTKESGDYGGQLDDYGQGDAEEPTNFTWINGVGILVGVTGALFGVPLFF